MPRYHAWAEPLTEVVTHLWSVEEGVHNLAILASKLWTKKDVLVLQLKTASQAISPY
jgi:hypothetical protein